MSQQTLEFHWGKHHRTYVENLKKQVFGTELDGRTLEEIIVTSYNNGDIHPAFNNAAQACIFQPKKVLIFRFQNHGLIISLFILTFCRCGTMISSGSA